MEISVIDSEGKVKGKRELNNPLFSAPLKNSFVLHEVVRAYLANQRKGTHSTLTRTEVSGGGKKPWKQKGTGRARAGSARSPLWRGGGGIFGPQARSKKLKISKDLKSSILSTFITDLIENKRLQALDIVSFEKPSTKLAAKALETAGLKGRKICLIVDLKDPNTISSFSNIP